MKNLLFLIIGLVISPSVQAYCSSRSLTVFPGGSNIKQNSIFILEGYALSQTVILGLNKKHAVYLKSDMKKVKLLVTELLNGEFQLTQAVLKPESELEVGVEYTFCIDSLAENETIERYNAEMNKSEPVTFKILAEKDTLSPQLIAKPNEITKEYIEYGCGPSIHVVFSDSTLDSSEIMVKTTVKNLNTGEETSYYIQSYRNRIHVGHGMCSGAFAIENGREFEVAFSFMDSSGNITPWKGEKIKFTRPTLENRD